VSSQTVLVLIDFEAVPHPQLVHRGAHDLIRAELAVFVVEHLARSSSRSVNLILDKEADLPCRSRISKLWGMDRRLQIVYEWQFYDVNI
jgi:hypothetical protein